MERDFVSECATVASVTKAVGIPGFILRRQISGRICCFIRHTGLNANLRLGYFPKWGSIDLNGNWRFQHSSNSLRQTNTYTRNYSLGFNAYADLPGNIQLKTDATYTFRNGTNIRQGEDGQIVWNTGITWRFLKKKQAELSVYWADMLNQKKNYSRSTTSSGFSEHHTQQIGSYFIISMKYRFNRPLHKQ